MATDWVVSLLYIKQDSEAYSKPRQTSMKEVFLYNHCHNHSELYNILAQVIFAKQNLISSKRNFVYGLPHTQT